MNSANTKHNRYIFLGIIILLGVFLFSSLYQFFSAFLGALMFYVLSKSFICWLITKKGWSKSMSAVLVIIISFFLIVVPVAVLVSLLYNKISAVLAHPELITNSIKQADAILQKKYNFSFISDENINKIKSMASELLQNILNKTLLLVSTIIMMFFFLYFMIINTGRMEAALLLYLPFRKSEIKMFGDQLKHQTVSNSIGVPTIIIVQGLVAFFGFLIVGLKESGFWGVITGLTSVVPVIGTALVWIPVAFYMFITGFTWQGIFIILYGVLVLGTMDNVVRFVLAKKMADVHPIVTVLGVILGVQYFGFLGLIFGPLLISYFMILLKIYYLENRQQAGIKPIKKRQLIPVYMQPFLGIKPIKKKPPQQQQAHKNQPHHHQH